MDTYSRHGSVSVNSFFYFRTYFVTNKHTTDKTYTSHVGELLTKLSTSILFKVIFNYFCFMKFEHFVVFYKIFVSEFNRNNIFSSILFLNIFILRRRVHFIYYFLYLCIKLKYFNYFGILILLGNGSKNEEKLAI